MDIRAILESVGMTKDESRVYVTLLEMGSTSVPALSKKIKITTPHILDIIQHMKERGWVSEVFYDNQKQYNPLDPSLLLMDFKKSIKKFSDYLPDLLGIYNKTPFRPKVYFFEGIEGIKEVYNDTLLGENCDLFAYVNVHIKDAGLYNFLMEYAPRRVQRNIKAHVITARSTESKDYQNDDQYYLRETLLVDEPWFDLAVEVQIYPKKVSICSFGTEYVGMIIESEAIYTSFKNIFHLMWTNLKRNI